MYSTSHIARHPIIIESIRYRQKEPGRQRTGQLMCTYTTNSNNNRIINSINIQCTLNDSNTNQ